jgi:hypothetical protein
MAEGGIVATVSSINGFMILIVSVTVRLLVFVPVDFIDSLMTSASFA